MTREQFVKYKFRHSEEIVFEMPNYTKPVHCMLVGVDFEQELLCIVPIGEDYENDKFWARCEYCTKALIIKKSKK